MANLYFRGTRIAQRCSIHETPRISFLGHEERSVYDQERSGAAVGGGTGTIYDVSKTSIRRSLTPIVAFHAVRVSLPKLYCRKADFTRASPFRPRSSSSVTRGRSYSRRGNIRAWSSSTRMSFAGSREPAGPARHLFLPPLPLHFRASSRPLAPPRVPSRA